MYEEELQDWYYFSTPVYRVSIPRYLETLKSVSNEYLEGCAILDKVYPLIQTEMFHSDNRISNFVNDVSQTGWNILDHQGYDMDNLEVYIGELWLQSHLKYSSMDIHTHGYGSQLSAFYILNCDDKTPKLCLHDPRPAKIQSQLPEKLSGELRNSTRIIDFDLEPGQLIFTNSWLPHSFTRNGSDEPFNFIHMNLYVREYVCSKQSPIVI